MGLRHSPGDNLSVIYQFGTYALDTENFSLKMGAEAVPLEPQVFGVLVHLIENTERIVSKDDLIDAVWDGRIVSDTTLASRISAARKAVGDDGQSQAVIKTFPRRGFQFIAKLSDANEQQGAAENISPSGRPSIAVMPFTNLSGDPDQEYFADGVAEDIIMALSNIRQFLVMARNASFSFKSAAIDTQAIAEKLGVRYILEGSVRRAGKRLRIAAQLIDGRTGNHLWADRYDRDLEDVFAVQDEITRTVVGAIQPELTRAEQERGRLKPPESMDAWDCYQRGVWHTYRRTKADLAQARDLFNRAITLDPNMSQAYAGLVEACFFQVADATVDDKRDAITEAIAAGQMAIDLDSRDALAHYALGRAYTIANRHEDAAPYLIEAINLNPSMARAHYALGFALVNSGRPAQGVSPLETALQLSPHDPTAGQFMVQISRAHLFLGQFEEALKWAREALRQPNIIWTRWTALISVLGHLGRMEEASRAIEALQNFKPEVDFSFVERAEISVMTDEPTRELFLEGLRKAGFENADRIMP